MLCKAEKGKKQRIKGNKKMASQKEHDHEAIEGSEPTKKVKTEEKHSALSELKKVSDFISEKD